jgi:phosphoglycerate dehydrogenase-like enzyme
MKIWKNTSTLDGYDEGLTFTEEKENADIALLGSKPIKLDEFPNLKGIFRAGIGRDNVPEEQAINKGILVRYPSQSTVDIIFNETATFTCSLIFRMLYGYVGTIEPWYKYNRSELSRKTLLVIGTGNIGRRVAKNMQPFIYVMTFDILENDISELPSLISQADCITIHIPKTDENEAFMDKNKLITMKNGAVLVNTARGSIVDEDALYSEISSGRLRAAFDVFWQEPYNGKLKEFHPEKFYMSPHVASTCNGFLDGCRNALDDLLIELDNV